MPRVVCLDNNILSYALKRESTKADENFILRADQLMESLKNERVVLVLPAPVVAEFFVRVEPQYVEISLRLITNSFQVLPFDLQVAVIAARIQTERLILSEQSGQKLTTLLRRQLTVDVQIIAVAIARKVDVIYSENDDFLKVASGRIRAEKMPALTKPPSLFDAEEKEHEF